MDTKDYVVIKCMSTERHDRQGHKKTMWSLNACQQKDMIVRDTKKTMWSLNAC